MPYRSCSFEPDLPIAFLFSLWFILLHISPTVPAHLNLIFRLHFCFPYGLPFSMSVSSALRVQGNHFPIIFDQSILKEKYINNPKTRALTSAPVTRYTGLISSDESISTKGLPIKIVPATIISLRIIFPAKTAVANFHGLYFASPSGIYTKSSGIGVTDATNAPAQPYLLRSLCKGKILFLVLLLRMFLP